MEKTRKRLLSALLKDFTKEHTITSLAKELNMSRVGMWKLLKRLESEDYILLNPVGFGKTSTYIIKLNLNSLLVVRNLALNLTEDALSHKRWRVNFAELERKAEFIILYGSIIHSPKQANDIDLVGVISGKRKFIEAQHVVDKIQKTLDKKIHFISFTPDEFRKELKDNQSFIEAVEKGVVLFGQEKFVEFMRKLR